MIKRLRLKFIVINMGIATILLSAILGLVFYFTSANLETESIRMMERIASQPFQMDAPGELGEDVRLPFFTLQLGPHGELLEEYNLRYYRSDAPMSRFLVFADISSERATLDGLRRTCLLIGGLSFLAFLWVSVLLSKWAVRPVERAWQQQRQFVAAASHELKTPLTVIMTNAELLQDEARRSTFSSSILTMSRQMRALIEQMLELARTDSAESHLVLRPVDLSGLTARSLLPFEPLFFEQGLTLTSQVDEGITVSGDEEALRRVLEILLDNAQKYSSPGGETQVTLHRRGRNHCALTVANQGEPIPPEARRQIFQRFYRADPARSRNGSFGLGLSIAEGIVAQHHGTIDVTCAGGFNRFWAELPCRQE